MLKTYDRLHVEDLHSTVIAASGAFSSEYYQSVYVDVPEVLDSTRVLVKADFGSPPSMPSELAKDFSDASDELRELGIRDPSSLPVNTAHLSEATLSLLALRKASATGSGRHKGQVRRQLNESVDIDWAEYSRRVRDLGYLTEERPDAIYVAGPRHDHPSSHSNVGYAALVRGFLPIRSGHRFGMEPVIESDSGEVGLLPSWSAISGIYSVLQLPAWDKKLRMGLELSPAEADRARISSQRYLEEHERVD